VAFGGRVSFSVSTLVGKRDEPVLDLCARRVAGMMVDAGRPKPLLIALALRDHSASILRPILEAIEALRVW
jgi:proteasome assembly chaperone 3